MTARRTFSEGAVFLVPLKGSGYAVGLLVRADGRGRAYGEFFGPRVEDVKKFSVAMFQFSNPLLRCRFGDYGLRNGLWPVIGHLANWDRRHWMLPKFRRDHDDSALSYVTTYDDDLNAHSETIEPTRSVDYLPLDGQYGSGVVEVQLSKLLGLADRAVT